MILGYIRVSSDSQRENSSPEEQTNKINALAAMRGAKAYDVTLFSDIGVSGATSLVERPAGKRLLDNALIGDVIVACKLDRLFRSATDALVTVQKLKEKGVDLVLLDMGLEPVTTNGASKLFFGMLALVAEFERDRIAERTEDGRQAKIKRGGHVYGEAVYGFRIEGEGKDTIEVPDDDEQEIINFIYEANKTMSIPVIRHQLDALNYRNRNGGPFQYIQVQNIIRRLNKHG